MADKMRWRYGDTNPVIAAVDSETVIEIGDLLWQDKDDAKPASHVGMSNTDFDVAQQGFARLFLGVSMQWSRNGETAPVRVGTTGVYEMDCPSGTFELGDLVGVDHQLEGGHDEVNDGRESCTLLDQHVERVAGPRNAIARVAKREPAARTAVLVDIRSTVMTGGITARA